MACDFARRRLATEVGISAVGRTVVAHAGPFDSGVSKDVPDLTDLAWLSVSLEFLGRFSRSKVDNIALCFDHIERRTNDRKCDKIPNYSQSERGFYTDLGSSLRKLACNILGNTSVHLCLGTVVLRHECRANSHKERARPTGPRI